LRSGFVLAIRQGLIAVISAVGVLALSHILAPAQFAYFGWTIAVATVVTAVGDLGYGAALIRSGRVRELIAAAIDHHWRRLLPAAVLASAVILLLPLSSTVRISALLLVVAAALLAGQMVPTSLCEAEGRFGTIGAIEVMQRAVLIVAAITLAEIFHRGWEDKRRERSEGDEPTHDDPCASSEHRAAGPLQRARPGPAPGLAPRAPALPPPAPALPPPAPVIRPPLAIIESACPALARS
jgi:MFS family permease